MAKNTARRPNINWKISDLVKNGFADAFLAAVQRYRDTGEDSFEAVYFPPDNLAAFARLSAERVPPEVLAHLKKIMQDEPPEHTIRQTDEARTLLHASDETTQCPPWCT